MSAQAIKTKEYETIYILGSDVDADAAEKVQGRVAEVVERAKGRLVKVEGWGRRKLAYPVAKQKRGIYVFVKYVGVGALVQEVERNLRLQDTVLKFITVQTNDQVDVAAITVDPEEVKLGRLDLPPDDDKDESPERALGLVDLGPDAPRDRGPVEEGDDFDDLPESSPSDTPPKPEGEA